MIGRSSLAALFRKRRPALAEMHAEISDQAFRDRFRKLPMIIDAWVRPHRSLAGARVLDFGCGEGITALGLAMNYGPAQVIGVDIMPDPERCMEQARKHLGLESMPSSLRLHQVRPGELPNDARELDLVYAWSVFEHVDQTILDALLTQLHDRLKPGGLAFLQIDPLYYSSNGSHLSEKVPVPWGHLSMQANLYEASVRAACGSPEEFESLWSTYRTLNRITADELKKAVERAGFRVERFRAMTDPARPPASLRAIYRSKVLRTQQVVILARKRQANGR